MKDRLDKDIKLGDIVVYATAYSNSATLHLGKVTDIKESDKQHRLFITRLTESEVPPFAWKPGIVDQFNANPNYSKTNKVLVINAIGLDIQ